MKSEQYQEFKNKLNAFKEDTYGDQFKLSCCRIQPVSNLTDEEEIIVKKAVDKRRYEFSAGRCCARRCLFEYGLKNVTLPKGDFGEPIWPEGYTGSITHHSNLAVSIVAKKSSVKYIGVDILKMDEKLGNPDLILDQEEADLIKELFPAMDPGLLVFSMKEAAIKICSPMLKSFIGFHDLKLKKNINGSLYVAHRSVDQKISIHWLRLNTLIVCFALIQ